MARNEILKSDLANDFAMIDELRKFTACYLKVNINRKNDNYMNIKYLSVELKNYPKDNGTCLAIKIQKEQDELLRKQQLEKEAAEENVRKGREELEAKLKQEKEAILRLEQIEKDCISNEASSVEREKKRLIAFKANEIIPKDSEKHRKQMDRDYNRRLNSFSNLGF